MIEIKRRPTSRVDVRDAQSQVIEQSSKFLSSEEFKQIVGTRDSFTNFSASLGIGTDNPSSGAGYSFNPITRIRTMLEWIHRGSWLGGLAVDIVADDMTRSGTSIQSDLDPVDIKKVDAIWTEMQVWEKLNETIKWSRLFGGSLGLILIDGQDPKTPLRLDTIGKGQFRGILPLDRWMVEPSMEDLVTELGPELGLPKYYRITAQAPALPRQTIHHSRCIRLDGVKLPYWQRLQENMWGISILERLYDRMTGFDAATTGASQLIYKAYLRTLKMEGFREVVAAGGPPLQGLLKYVQMMRSYQTIEGITLLDANDEFEGHTTSAFSGLAEVLRELKEQVSGCLQIPMVRLFGQSPSGFSSGDADLQLYYDGIDQKQNADLRPGLAKIYHASIRSAGMQYPKDLDFTFNSLWKMTDAEKSEITDRTTSSVINAYESSLLKKSTAVKELKQLSNVTGTFSNITAEDIADAEADDDLEEAPAPEVQEEGSEEPTTEVQQEGKGEANAEE